MGGWVIGDGVASCVGKISEVQDPGQKSRISSEGKAAVSLSEEGFGEVNGGGGAASEKAWRRMLVLRVGEQAMAAMAGRRARRFL